MLCGDSSTLTFEPTDPTTKVSNELFETVFNRRFLPPIYINFGSCCLTGLSRGCLSCLWCEVSDILICRSTKVDCGGHPLLCGDSSTLTFEPTDPTTNVSNERFETVFNRRFLPPIYINFGSRCLTGLSRGCLPCLWCEVSDILICRSTEGATTCDPTFPGVAQPAISPVTPRLERAVTSPPALHC